MNLRARYSGSVGLLLLSLLWAVDWLLPDLFPRSAAKSWSPSPHQAILFSVFALIATAVALVRRLRFPRGRAAWSAALIGPALFVVPFAATAFARGWISSFDQVAVLCLTPIFAVVLEPYIQGGGPARARAALHAAVVAVAGILCFFPLEAPGSFRAAAALLAFVVAALGLAATNCLAVRLARSVPGQSTLPMAALAGGATAFCFFAAAPFTPGTWSPTRLPFDFLQLILIDLPALFLLFWLFGRLAASRLTTSFLFTPLFAALAGLALEQMLPPLRSMLGIALLAGGAGWLLFAPPASYPEEWISPGSIRRS